MFFMFFDTGEEIEQVEEPIIEPKKNEPKKKDLKELIDMYSYAKLLEELDKENYDKLREMLLDNIREEAANKGGKKKPFAIIQGMFKKLNDEVNFKNKAVELSDGRFGFVDGHRVFIADTDLGYTERCDLKLEQLLGHPTFDGEVEVDVTDLKKFSATVKAEKKKNCGIPQPYIMKCSDDFFVGCNPFFLQDAINFSGITKLKFQKSIGNIQKNPLYLMDDDDKIIAIVLPVNINVPIENVA